MLAHYIGFEAIKDDALKTIDRLNSNWHEGILDVATPNIFAHSGLEHPSKLFDCPYNGPEACEHATETIDDGMFDAKEMKS